MTTETETQARPATPFERLGGHEVVEGIVGRFYDLVETDPAYAALRAMHAVDLGPVRRGLVGFLTGWAGGPRDWFEANPGRCMMSIHGSMKIGGDVAAQWAEAMRRAIADVAPADQALAEKLTGTLTGMALAMGR